MKGLFRNNFLSVWMNAKVFSVFIIVWGILVVAVPSQTLQMYFIMVGIVGFSINAVAGIGSESGSKWGKYKLTLPIKRADVVKSQFLSQIFWLMIGILLTGIATFSSCFLHGCPSDQLVGILCLFALGISISLFMGAMFTPLFYLGGEEKSIVFLVITLLCSNILNLCLCDRKQIKKRDTNTLSKKYRKRNSNVPKTAYFLYPHQQACKNL